MVQQGFEVGVHGLTHRGNLFSSEKAFREKKARINRYLKEWESVGFRTPSMYHNLKWIGELEIEYDSSTFDTDPFEPQPDGVGTIFPFWVEGRTGRGGFVELPYTLAQDSTLFLLLKEESIDLWKRKLRWIAVKGGMALVNTHPDYMRFDHARTTSVEYPARYYEEFLSHILSEYEEQYWHVLPREMARFWRESFVDRASGINSQGQKEGKSKEDET
jgi:peptidoglycan/xylan/chitin deacetylase (PgdA/CDA1 family)